MLFKIFWLIRTLFYKIIFKKIGKMSYIGKLIFIKNASKIEIGNRVRIFPGARMEVHRNGEITICDDVSIGQHLHIISGKKMIINSKVTISANVFITDLEHGYNEIDVHIMKQELIFKETIIGENCFIGYGAVIQAGTKLGKQCIIGANSVVKGDFPDYCVIVGAPAKIIKKYNFERKVWEKV